MIQNTQIKNPKMCVVSMDVVWTSEFAANGYVEAVPSDVSTDGMLKAAVDSATYFDKLYGIPATSDGGLLYYRTDLLEKYGFNAPPKTYEEMAQQCQKIIAGEDDSKLNCFAGQYNKYEGLVCNFDEFVHSAGGVIVGEDGKPNVNTPEALKGLTTMVDFFKDGTIPKEAITWQEENGRTAFQHGELVFHRNWGYVYNHAANDKDSTVKGKFDVSVLPGITVVPGIASLGGHTNAIAKYADAKGTGLDYAKFVASKEAQKSNTLATSNSPVLEELYSDPDLVKKFPFMPTQLTAIQNAVPRPKAVAYGDVTLAIQDSVYAALQGQVPPDQALQQLQSKLETLIK
jgi:multiple sugar transport system substrate-binding protein